jgi:hypothetical protein
LNFSIILEFLGAKSMSEAYRTWSSLEQLCYNPDGTMKEDFKQQFLAEGTTLAEIQSREARKKQNIREFEAREQWFQEKYGITYSEWSRPTDSSAQRHERQRLALEEGTALCELPAHIEPDDYYDYHAARPD